MRSRTVGSGSSTRSKTMKGPRYHDVDGARRPWYVKHDEDTLSVRLMSPGWWEVREIVDMHIGDPLEWLAAYALDGGYIGGTKLAHRLARRGIIPETVTGKTVASIGYSVLDGLWYGWSHRAIYGFRRGAVSKVGHLPFSDRHFVVEDPRQTAIDFAAEVG